MARNMRLREVTLGELTYRCSNGIVQFKLPANGEWVKSHLVDTEYVPALADLIANPHEPVETLEQLLGSMCAVAKSRDAEFALREFTPRIHAWLAQQPAPEMTAAQHVAALVRMGARRVDGVNTYKHSPDPSRAVDILILPPEVTP